MISWLECLFNSQVQLAGGLKIAQEYDGHYGDLVMDLWTSFFLVETVRIFHGAHKQETFSQRGQPQPREGLFCHHHLGIVLLRFLAAKWALCPLHGGDWREVKGGLVARFQANGQLSASAVCPGISKRTNGSSHLLPMEHTTVWVLKWWIPDFRFQTHCDIFRCLAFFWRFN